MARLAEVVLMPSSRAVSAVVKYESPGLRRRPADVGNNPVRHMNDSRHAAVGCFHAIAYTNKFLPPQGIFLVL